MKYIFWPISMSKKIETMNIFMIFITSKYFHRCFPTALAKYITKSLCSSMPQGQDFRLNEISTNLDTYATCKYYTYPCKLPSNLKWILQKVCMSKKDNLNKNICVKFSFITFDHCWNLSDEVIRGINQHWLNTLTHWGWDKWLPFSRRHFQMHFLEWKCIIFYFTEVCSQGSN